MKKNSIGIRLNCLGTPPMAVISARIQWPTPGYICIGRHRQKGDTAWRSHLSNERNGQQLHDLRLVVLFGTS